MDDDTRKISELTVAEVKGLLRDSLWYALKLWLLFTIGFPVMIFGGLALLGYIAYQV